VGEGDGLGEGVGLGEGDGLGEGALASNAVERAARPAAVLATRVPVPEMTFSETAEVPPAVRACA